VCPVSCCLPDPNNPESEEQLAAKARRIHPEKPFDMGTIPSRFRK
jgi:hypothetical protein